jgi:hypothetical protein
MAGVVAASRAGLVQVVGGRGAGGWLLVAGCWLLVAGCWLLDARCWMLERGSTALRSGGRVGWTRPGRIGRFPKRIAVGVGGVAALAHGCRSLSSPFEGRRGSEPFR